MLGKIIESAPKVNAILGVSQVLNHRCVTIKTNAALSIISTKMSVCFVVQFDSVLAFL